jgi:heme oxygenase
MSLRDAIKDKHVKAEQHRFVRLLLSGNMPVLVYGEYIANQAECYRVLEAEAAAGGLLTGIEGIKRAALIAQDAAELGKAFNIHPSTRDYAEHLSLVPSEQLWAHIYGRHFADLYGGQLIKKVVPGAGRMYTFKDRSGLIDAVRLKLSDDLAQEANVVFDFALRLFDEIADAHSL